jgi:recyclin-1
MAPRESGSSSSRGHTRPLSMQVLTPQRIHPPSPQKMSLPVELLEQIVDYMPVPTQLRFAQTNHAMRDMVYDDTRWVVKLKAMGTWNDEEARRAAEEELILQRQALYRATEEAVLGRPVTNGTSTTTIFDASEIQKLEIFPVPPVKDNDDLLDLQSDSLEAFGEFQSVSAFPEEKAVDSVGALNILSSVVSRRGQARSEFGRVYAVLAPIYVNLSNSSSLEDSTVFRQLQQKEEQAKLLKILELFGRSRAVDDWTRCQKRIAWITETFERQMLTEFEEYTI